MAGSVVGRPAPEIGNGSREEAPRECTPAAHNKLDDNCDDSYPKQGFDHSQSAAMLNIVVSHGSNLHNVSVSPDSTFGDLKRTFAEEILIKPQMQKILFRGKEKEDSEQLQMAGVKDRSKVVLVEDTLTELSSEQTNPTVEISRGVAEVSGIRAEVDKLSEKVSTLETAVHSGTKVDEKDIIYLTEMLMRQLLKLDGIEAQGDGKIQRKMEVRRVQSFVDAMDALKARNSNPFGDYNNSASVTTEWEKFDSGVEGITAPTAMPSTTKVTQDWEQFD